MEREYNYDTVLDIMLRECQLRLFDFQGRELAVHRERHVEEYADMHCGNRGTIWVQANVQLAFDLWASWEVHVARSDYADPIYGSVHIDRQWLESGSGSPPVVIMLNRPLADDTQLAIESPVSFQWKGERFLGPVECRLLRVPEIGEGYRYYLQRSVRHWST
jgi:hypothetical protein